MWLSSVFGPRNQSSSRSKASKSRRDSLHARRLFLEPLEDRRLLAFDPAVSYLAGSGPQALATGHFNSDLFLDIAVANAGSNDVSLLLGNANGTFQSAVNSPTGNGPVSIAVGDFNEDGNLDLATANAGDVSVLLGDGNGTFEASSSINIGSNPASVAVGDFNSDGTLDLVVTSNVQLPGSYYYGYYGGTYYSPGPVVGYANVLLGNGGGSFAAPTTTSLGYGTHTSANVADLNGDGIDDFVTLNSDYSTADVLLTTATGTLGPVTSFATGWYPRALTIGDFTNDGILDLATAGQTVDILPGLGNGTFQPVVRQYIDPVSLAAADFNLDGKLDLVAADPWANSVSALLGLGTGTLTLPLSYAAGSTPSAVAVGDFNGDGRADVAAAGASSGDVSVLLNDGDWPALTAPSLRISDAAAVTEGNLGTTDATFNVTLSAPSTQTVTVHYDTVIGSATGDDFQSASGTVTFGPGETTKPITVTINGDRLAEYYESFGVSLTDPSGAFVSDSIGWGAILDDEPYVSITDYVTVTEGDSGTTAVTFAVTLSAAYNDTVTVDFATADLGYYDYWYGAPASAGDDYTANSGTVTFAPNETTKDITVLVHGDRNAENDESFLVNLVGSNSAHLSYSQGIGYIVDDEPVASISDATVLETNSGTTAMTFNVTLSAPSLDPVTVTYTTLDGYATAAGGDYVAAAGTLNFAPGVTSMPITVQVVGDRVGEYDEAFYVQLTSVSGAKVGDNWGYGTILDNEPRISIEGGSVTEGHRGTKALTFTVTLAVPYDQAVTVNYATQTGSANGSDFTATSGSLTFAAGQTSQKFTVQIKGDRKKEYNEYFYVVLSNSSTNATIWNAYGDGTILNDD